MTDIWWLSFADESGCLGVCIVEAPGFIDAVVKAHHLKINPGGEVAGFEVPNDAYEAQPKFRDRLIPLAELEEEFGAKSIREWGESCVN